MDLNEAIAVSTVLAAFPGSKRLIPIDLDYGPMKRCQVCRRATMTRAAGDKPLCYACAGH